MSFIHIPTQNTGIKIKDSIWIFCFVDPNQSKQPNKPNTKQPNQTQPNPTIKWNKTKTIQMEGMELHVWADQM